MREATKIFLQFFIGGIFIAGLIIIFPLAVVGLLTKHWIATLIASFVIIAVFTLVAFVKAKQFETDKTEQMRLKKVKEYFKKERKKMLIICFVFFIILVIYCFLALKGEESLSKLFEFILEVLSLYFVYILIRAYSKNSTSKNSTRLEVVQQEQE